VVLGPNEGQRREKKKIIRVNVRIVVTPGTGAQQWVVVPLEGCDRVRDGFWMSCYEHVEVWSSVAVG